MDIQTIIRKATTYVKTLNGIEWKNSIKFECQCPDCRGSVTNQNSGVYLPESGRVFCWQPNCRFSKDRATTGHSHSIVTYLAVCNGGDVDINGRADTKAYGELKEFLELYPEDTTRYVTKVRIKRSLDEFKQIQTPAYQVPINNPSGDQRAVDYIKNRGFDPEWLWNEFKISYICRESKLNKFQDYNGYIIIPYFDHLHRVTFFQARDYLFRPAKKKNVPNGALRWMNPSESVIGVGKSDFIFNGHKLATAEKLYLSEAVFDAMELAQIKNDAVKGSLGGSSISDNQLDIIASSTTLKDIYIIMDGGAFQAAINIANRLLSHKQLKDKNIYIVPLHMHVYPNGKKKKDANELGYQYVESQVEHCALKVSKFSLVMLKMKMFSYGKETFMNKNYIVFHEES